MPASPRETRELNRGLPPSKTTMYRRIESMAITLIDWIAHNASNREKRKLKPVESEIRTNWNDERETNKKGGGAARAQRVLRNC